jgi:hypothetical protein
MAFLGEVIQRHALVGPWLWSFPNKHNFRDERTRFLANFQLEYCRLLPHKGPSVGDEATANSADWGWGIEGHAHCTCPQR